MAEFIKSKPTSFTNKPVGVVRVDTGAMAAGRSLAEFGNTLQKIFWKEAEDEAIANDIETAKTLPIYDENNNLKYVKGNFSKVGKDKANRILSERYANQLTILSKKAINQFKINRTKDNKFDKAGFDLDVKHYIEGHLKEFQKNRTDPTSGTTYNLNNFVPDFLPKIQNIAAIHGNDILNKQIAHEDRIAVQNTKINLEDKIKELQALTFNFNTNQNYNLDEDQAEERDELFDDIQSLKKDILAEADSLVGVDNGYTSVGITEIKSRVNKATTRGVIEPILAKLQNDDTALKIVQSAFQTSKLSSNLKNVLLKAGLNEQEVLNVIHARKDHDLRPEDVKVIAGEISVASGVANSIQQKLDEEKKSVAFSNKYNTGGTFSNTNKERNAFNDFISGELGINLTADNIAQFNKETTNKLINYLNQPHVNILPSSIHDIFSNDKIMTRYVNQSSGNQKIIASKFLNLWENVAFRKGTTSKNMGDALAKLNLSDDVYKRMDNIRFLTRITGDALSAFNIAGQTSSGDADIDINVLNTGINFGYKAGNPSRANPNLVADANDVIRNVLQETDIPFSLHKKFSPYVRSLLNQKQLVGADGKGVGFDKDSVISSLNHTYEKLYVVDEMVYDIHSNDLTSPSYFSPKRKYPNEYTHNQFVNNVNRIIATETKLNGLGEDVYLLPDFRNTSTNTNYYTLVTEDGMPILDNSGKIIEINTEKVDKNIQIQAKSEISKVINADYSNKLQDTIKTLAKKNNKSLNSFYDMLDKVKINPKNIYDNKMVGELFKSKDLYKTKPFGYDLSTQDLIAYNHVQDLYHSPTGTDMMEKSLVGIPTEAKKKFRESMKLSLNLQENIASRAFTVEKKKLAELAKKNLDAMVDNFENYKPPAIPYKAIEQFNKGMRSYMKSTKDAVASNYNGEPYVTGSQIADFFTISAQPNMMPDRGDQFNILSKGSQNPMWKTIYNNTLENIKELPKEIQEIIKENFTTDVAIGIQDDLITVLQNTAKHEGYDAMPYLDAKTVSVGAGFNMRYLTDEEINIIPSKRRRDFLFNARAYLEKHKVGDRNATKTSEEALAYINNQLRGGTKKDVVGKDFKVILPEEANMMFALKMTTILNKFQKDFPAFAEIPVEMKSALIDFAYQHGYESHKKNWSKYWASVTGALSTDDVNLREFFFNRAGFNMIYNYEDFEDVDGSMMVTGKTKAVRQFDEFGSNRYYDRAENLGFLTDAKPSFLSSSKKKATRIFEKLTDYTLQGFGM